MFLDQIFYLLSLLNIRSADLENSDTPFWFVDHGKCLSLMAQAGEWVPASLKEALTSLGGQEEEEDERQPEVEVQEDQVLEIESNEQEKEFAGKALSVYKAKIGDIKRIISKTSHALSNNDKVKEHLNYLG